jgi:hypothetical protein
MHATTSLVAAAMFAAIAAAPTSAFAQASDATRVESIGIGGNDSGNYRSRSEDWMVSPIGMTTVGGAFNFLTADDTVGDEPLKLTDVVLVSLRASHTFAKLAEINGAATFLPKQPSYTDELIWQSASFGAKLGFAKRYAIYGAVSGGRTSGDTGLWSGGGIGVQARKSLHDTLLIEGGLGGSLTALFEDERATTSWVSEVTTHGEMIFRVPNGMMAGWMGAEFRFPVADDSSMSMTGAAPYDPQTRVNLQVGVVLSYIPNWDIYGKIEVVDRGDVIDPSTTFPILEGGFDQKHLIIGLTRRFASDDKRDDHAYLAE